MEKRKRGKPITHPPIKNCKTGEVFISYTEAAESVNGNRWGIMRCCYNMQKSHHGVKFIFVK